MIPTTFGKLKSIGMIGTIYKLTSPSGKCYIGQSVDITTRKRAFYNENAYYSGTRMDNAIKKYGAKAFEFEILVQIYGSTKEDLRKSLDELETYYIKKYDSYHTGYNMTEGGSGSTGCFQTEESRKKISLSRIGKPSPNLGKRISEAQKEALRAYAKTRIGNKNPFYGRSHSDLVKKKIGDSNSKPVLQLDLNTDEVIAEFKSAKAAGEYFGKPRANSEIIKVCKQYISPTGRHYKTALGYKWMYKESSTTIPKGSTLQANGSGSGEPHSNMGEDIV